LARLANSPPQMFYVDRKEIWYWPIAMERWNLLFNTVAKIELVSHSRLCITHTRPVNFR